MRKLPNIEALLQHSLIVDGNNAHLSIVEMQSEGTHVRIDHANLTYLHGPAHAVVCVAVCAGLDLTRGRVVSEQAEAILLEVKEERVLLVALSLRSANTS